MNQSWVRCGAHAFGNEPAEHSFAQGGPAASWWPERLVTRVCDSRRSSYIRISDPPSELASSSNTLTRTSITVSRCINALAHRATLSTEPDESRCDFGGTS